MSLIYPFSFIGGTKTLSLKSYVFSFSNVNMPSDVSPGDLIIHIQSGILDSSSIVGGLAPSGYTSIVDFSPSSDTKAIISAKVATSSETGGQLRTIGPTQYDTNAIFVFQSNQQISSFTYGGIVYHQDVENFNTTVGIPTSAYPSIAIGFTFSKYQVSLLATPTAVLNTGEARSVVTINIFNWTPQSVSLSKGWNAMGHLIGFYVSPN